LDKVRALGSEYARVGFSEQVEEILAPQAATV